ncbi:MULTISPECIES: DEAD/DEAH box helicase [unclassified Janthinobacterium]|uniref:DEAD/DEAH box helicase n=1 Tax=unclassified Janthinobacterium TaxID=2610881 RepID=UPI001622EB77|nr:MULTISPECIES: DEAD/DEAH box helicase [unclassified Janthinobacterium]MBB5367129.1 ATP-dependent Lhr-like helicase [Janthinobacterium sp. K2C7]MBB5380393.1 ATP-dependent Lhr-like helicase [Janthinobacterium sp. K2Li3]MBB5385511.1 ATP-dependent Lhr-like helicase [Janthinobacterium sp. K2E3]
MTKRQSSSFALLDERIQRWIWAENWSAMRDAQERAIPALVACDHDVLIAAATAAGKTEAAFFPILTHLLADGEGTGLCIYISPIKALINDQFLRLERLCKQLDIPVWPWHGDISSSSKNRFFKQPSGVVLITPESLEAMLCNRGFQVPQLLAKLRYIVIDELHAFIGSERGKQLQSLLQRLDLAVGRKVVRVGLSATLGDLDMAAEFLRLRAGAAVEIIHSNADPARLDLQIKAYVEPAHLPETEHAVVATSPALIAQHLFHTLRGSNNLVFPNSRSLVEEYAYSLGRLCESHQIANEFWPHHGNLSREIREETEAALKNKGRPATAICTNTLELGIDIGAVKSIAQVGSPPSVASMRQRLGRSGRRPGEPAILRGYVIEHELTDQSSLEVQLRTGLLTFTAMVSLLLEKWVEPPQTGGLHFSTFIQQLLSLIAQRGGMQAADAYRTLCVQGPFAGLEKSDFLDLLRHMGKLELIQQESSGLLLHGVKGERIVNHYSFYAAFAAEEEYRVVCDSRVLGSLPISSAIGIGDFIVFAGKTWRVESIDEDGKTILVSKTSTGKAPAFTSSGGQLHAKIRERMRELYRSTEVPRFLDADAVRLLQEGRDSYARFGLDQRLLLTQGGAIFLLTWLGDQQNEALAAVLRRAGFTVAIKGTMIEIFATGTSVQRVAACLLAFASQALPDAQALLEGAYNLRREKWDWALPEHLLKKSFASLQMDIAGAHAWAQEQAHAHALELETQLITKEIII